MRSVRSVSLWALCIAVALVGVPGLAAAQNAVLYEVTETMKIKGSPKPATRNATATLMGAVQAGTSICPAELASALGIPTCGLVALATDSLSLLTGKGPVNGRFSVVIQGDNPVDGPELTIFRGNLRGTIDLSLALNGIAPMGHLQGEWWGRGERGSPLEGLRVGGTLAGTFRLPYIATVPANCLQTRTACAWVSKPSYVTDLGLLEDLVPSEYSLGVPVVRLELTFTESGFGRPEFSSENSDD